MTGQNYLRDLKERLRSLDTRIADARQRLKSGAPKDKVAAAGDLGVLEKRHKALEEKIASASEHDADQWSTAHVELQQEADDISRLIERWLANH